MTPLEIAKKVPARYLPYLLAILLAATYVLAKGKLDEANEWHAKVEAHLESHAGSDTLQDERLGSIEHRLDRFEQRQLEFLQAFYRQVGQWEKAKEIDAEVDRRKEKN